jgi:hypothetical protein
MQNNAPQIALGGLNGVRSPANRFFSPLAPGNANWDISAGSDAERTFKGRPFSSSAKDEPAQPYIRACAISVIMRGLRAIPRARAVYHARMGKILRNYVSPCTYSIGIILLT